jgi:hypothetical protein
MVLARFHNSTVVNDCSFRSILFAELFNRMHTLCIYFGQLRHDN